MIIFWLLLNIQEIIAEQGKFRNSRAVDWSTILYFDKKLDYFNQK